MAPGTNAYEQHRAAQLKKNKQLLHALGLPSISAAFVEAAAPPPATPKKRKAVASPTDGTAPKVRKCWGSRITPGSARRSSRVLDLIAQKEQGSAFQSSAEFPNGLDEDDEDEEERADGSRRARQCDLFSV